MKKAIVNGREIPQEAVQFELDRLVRFYMNHGMTVEEVKTNLAKLQDKALEQAIGARLLLDRAMQIDLPVTAKDIDADVEKVVAQVGGRDNYEKALAAQGITDAAFRKELEKGAKVNMLVNQACAHVAEPTEEEVTAFYTANKAEYGEKTIVDVHDQIKDLLRHEARGRAMDIYVEELRESAQIEYREDEHA